MLWLNLLHVDAEVPECLNKLAVCPRRVPVLATVCAHGLELSNQPPVGLSLLGAAGRCCPATLELGPNGPDAHQARGRVRHDVRGSSAPLISLKASAQPDKSPIGAAAAFPSTMDGAVNALMNRILDRLLPRRTLVLDIHPPAAAERKQSND